MSLEHWEWRRAYNKLRHTCGYTGANAPRFDPNCPKCAARANEPLPDTAPIYNRLPVGDGTFTDDDVAVTRMPTLEDYDRGYMDD